MSDRARQTVTPYLLYEDGEGAIEWLTRAFGFREARRMTGNAGSLHAELEVAEDGSLVYLGTPPSPSFRNPREAGRTASIYVVVGDDVDARCERAREAGAEIVEEPHDIGSGFRHFGCRDPQGHEWFFARPIESV
jgi:uncharacterized glyoxalase superfamily protein PhnB